MQSNELFYKTFKSKQKRLNSIFQRF